MHVLTRTDVLINISGRHERTFLHIFFTYSTARTHKHTLITQPVRRSIP